MPSSRPLAGSLADPDRLLALQATGLGAPAIVDESLDRLTALVQRCLNVPVALVSLVEEHRQVFASQQGLAEPWCTMGETPLSHSFCQHVVSQEAPLVVEDARQDARVRDNLAVADLGVVAYLGVPLRTPDGHTIGSLCAIDGSPRRWPPGDVEALEALAEAAMAAIALRFDARAAEDRMTAGLGRSRALFRAVFEAAPPAFVLRPSGAVATANAAGLALADLPEAAVLGLRVWSVLPVFGADEDALRTAVTTVNGTPVTTTVTLADAPTTLRVRSVPDGDGLLLLEAA